jgi:transposase
MLVKMVLEEGQSIACAARRLGLKPSTARMILNKFKSTGTYPMKHFKKPMKGVCAPTYEVKL